MRRRVLMVVTVMAAAITGGCGSSDEDDGTADRVAKDAEIVLAIPGDPGTLDPTKTLSGTAQQINRFAYDTLAYVSPDGELVSGVASSWEVSPTTIEFTIDDKVTCADGTKLTPSAIRQFFEFLKTSKSAMIGTALPDADYKVEADDAEGTFTFVSGKPNGFLLQNLAAVPLVCPEGLENPGTLTKTSHGSGPYVLTEVVSADEYTLERRDGYAWGPEGATTEIEGLPKKVTFRVVPNEATTANLMLGGDVDVANIVGPDRDRLPTDAGYHVYDVATDSILMFFNEEEGLPASDANVRKGLASALDVPELLQVATSGYGLESTSMVSATPKTCDDSAAASAVIPTDPDAAGAALDEAGYSMSGDVRRKGSEPLSVRLAVVLPGATGQDAAEVVRQAWGDLGVEVEIKTVAASQLTDLLFATRDYDAVILPMQVSLPSTVYGLLVGPPPPEGSNFASLTNAEYEELATEALTTPGDAGCDGWTQAQAALYAHADVVPIGAATAAYIGDGVEFSYVQGQIDPMSLMVRED